MTEGKKEASAICFGLTEKGRKLVDEWIDGEEVCTESKCELVYLIMEEYVSAEGTPADWVKEAYRVSEFKDFDWDVDLFLELLREELIKIRKVVWG